MKVETHRTKAICRRVSSSAADIERGVRQILSDKVSGTMMGLWLLVPEYLRLGIWDLVRGWTGDGGGAAAPRLALQMVNEAALCVTGVRQQRCLSQKGFEVANGLPFVATDTDIHLLLARHTVAESIALQAALGKVRRASGHFSGALLAIDPHRMLSTSRRQMARKSPKASLPSTKLSQLFFCADADTMQPVCFTIASSSRQVSRATPEVLNLAADILPGPFAAKPLLLGDAEHFSVSLFNHVVRETHYDLLVPMPCQPYYRQFLRSIPPDAFVRQWIGYATAAVPFTFGEKGAPPLWCFAQRSGESTDSFSYKGFICTSRRDELDALSSDFPKRWHVEEFFNLYQDLGWKKAGTLNLNIRYGRTTMALIAQAAIHQLRQHLPTACAQWNSSHLAQELFKGFEGDIRVSDDTVVVTFYNAPDADTLSAQYAGLPWRLQAEGIDPHIPWLYGLKLDFRFR